VPGETAPAGLPARSGCLPPAPAVRSGRSRGPSPLDLWPVLPVTVSA
jgi:hypothetical protein